MKTKMLAIITAALSFTSPVVRGAADYFLQLDGIKGESSDDRHRDTIEIYSFSWGCSNPPPTAGTPDGPIVFTGLEVTAHVSSASPQLLMACATGKRIPKAIIWVRKGGSQEEYLQITMVSSWSSSSAPPPRTESGASESPPPADSFSLNFTKIEYKYIAYDNTEVIGTAGIAPRQ